MSQEPKLNLLSPDDFSKMSAKERFNYLSNLAGSYEVVCDNALRAPDSPITPFSPELEKRKQAHGVYQSMRTLIESAKSDPDPSVRDLACELDTKVQLYKQAASGQFGI